jgi:rSAM/selenodomain-associated transferase 2/rSAM/selenodomain-associated transferase 1
MSHRQRLIVFTRYPVPGTTKTRLIPALGPEGAANLQRQMTERTLTHVRHWQRHAPQGDVEIRFSGGDRPQMAAWLGENWPYCPQGDGDLGDRLARAVADGLAAGARALVVIGIDCPQITDRTLTQAFQALEDHDLVLGPATDGGYYLIGLRQFHPALFRAMPWSSDRVLAQTLAIAQAQGLRIATLAPLSDVDQPDDLSIWNAGDRPAITLSVIIPTLNEAATIQSVIQAVQAAATEVIVVDGGSQDETVSLARQAGALTLQGQVGRGSQMNRGAAIATGDRLLFLHGDTHPPPEAATIIHQTLADATVAAGAFTLAIDSPKRSRRWVEWGVRWRSRWGWPYGDQGLFLRRRQFEQVGGFPDQPLLEDVALVQRLRQQGRLVIVPQAVWTSDRRWQRLGVFRTTLLNQAILLGYWAGIPPQRLAQWYRRPRSHPPR